MKRVFCIFIILFLLPFHCASTEAAFSDYTIESLVQTEGIVIPVFTEENLKKFEIPENEALQFISKLKLGWNLGNTFDAYDGYDKRKGLETETSWVGVKTNRELICSLKEAGFNLIRIPVSWHNHVIDEEYHIDPAWMNRIKEVAQWIADEDMYFIINVHHDNDKNYFYPDTAHYEQSEKYLSAIWKQMAEAFAEFDDHCILESMNEPRLVGTNVEWYLNQAMPQCQDAARCINRLNQKFVDIVRASGGNNADRYLSVPGYCASPDGVLSLLFEMPEDSAKNKIIIEVHAYRPYDFALNNKSNDSSFDLEKDSGKKSDIAGFMNSLYNRYIVNGIPVMIDEFGALQKNDGDLQSRVNFAAYYVASASTRGITCCWWDNHVFSGNGERFGIISRMNGIWKYPDIALAMLQNCLYNRE